jgi:hypothetical protein
MIKKFEELKICHVYRRQKRVITFFFLTFYIIQYRNEGAASETVDWYRYDAVGTSYKDTTKKFESRLENLTIILNQNYKK